MEFNIDSAQNFKRYNNFKKLGLYKTIKYIGFSVFALALLFALISDLGGPGRSLLYLLSAAGLVSGFVSLFLESYYQPKTYIETQNLAEGLNIACMEIIEETIQVAEENNFAQVEPILLLAGIERSKNGKYMLMRAGFGLEKDMSGMIAKAIASIQKEDQPKKGVIFSDVTVAVIAAAKDNAIANKRPYISVGDLLIGLIQKSDIFKKLMFEIKVEEADMKRVVEWFELLNSFSEKRKKPFYEKDVHGGIGKDWSFGYTPTLNQFARNVNQQIELTGEVRVYGRQKEIDEIERILSKSSQSNALLIGPHGIGKKTIVKGFVSRIVSHNVLPVLRYNQVFHVDTGALLSGSTSSGEITARLTKIFNEAMRAGNIILFFDNFHALFATKEGIGQINVSEIILPYLQAGINIIGATTIKEYHKNIEASPGIAAALDRVEVREPSSDETLKVLEEMVPQIEYRDGVFWPYQSLKEVVRVAERYVQNVPFPQKAIEVVDAVSVEVAKAGRKVIMTRDVDQYMEKKLEVPVAQAEGEEAEKLLSLEDFLHKRVVGQDEAIKVVANAMRRARSGIQSKERPIGNFLFLGPTGVGKTETSKALAEAYFGSEKSMIRVDMSEYQEASSIYRLIGSPPSAGNEGDKGQLTTAVMDNPFSLILLDEIEKAHKNILTLFLQVFDDGRLTDGTGQVIDFTNTIIIATSNAGSEYIRQSIQKGAKGDELKNNLLDYLQKRGMFRPEFLNRFDAVVAFHPLTQSQIVQIAKLMLDKLAKRMAEKEVTVEFTSGALHKLSEIGFDPVYGARPMRRAIQDKVENVLAQAMLSGKVPRGSKIVIEEKDIK